MSDRVTNRHQFNRRSHYHYQWDYSVAVAHLVGVDDGVEAVRDGEHGAGGEVVADGALDERVRARVHIGCSFVQQQHAVAPRAGARQAHQLPRAHAEVAAALRHLLVQRGCSISPAHPASRYTFTIQMLALSAISSGWSGKL